jgi:hypothetical protein
MHELRAVIKKTAQLFCRTWPDIKQDHVCVFGTHVGELAKKTGELDSGGRLVGLQVLVENADE